MGLYHELTFKIGNGPLFPVEIYIVFCVDSHHNDDVKHFKMESLFDINSLIDLVYKRVFT